MMMYQSGRRIEANRSIKKKGDDLELSIKSGKAFWTRRFERIKIFYNGEFDPGSG
jgi:hypothetical protein